MRARERSHADTSAHVCRRKAFQEMLDRLMQAKARCSPPRARPLHQMAASWSASPTILGADEACVQEAEENERMRECLLDFLGVGALASRCGATACHCLIRHPAWSGLVCALCRAMHVCVPCTLACRPPYACACDVARGASLRIFSHTALQRYDLLWHSRQRAEHCAPRVANAQAA